MDVAQSSFELFPHIEPYAQGMLELDGHHRMYWEECGNPRGMPVVFLHGGPGAGANASHRRFFDPQHYRIVIFDQRGAGRSRPFGDVRDNTTDHLVDDIERLRRHLEVDRWLVFGGSWGSTLALVYAIRHAERCAGLILRGIFLGRAREVDWFLHGMRAVFPEAARRFAEFLPAPERDDLLGNYHRRLMDADPAVHQPAAEAWSAYESGCSNLIVDASVVRAAAGAGALSLARIEAHFFVNDTFIDDDYIIDNVDVLRAIPGTIVQGRYDMVCPIATADELSRAWPEVNYAIVPNAGHSAMEPGIRSALVRATEEFKAESGL